MEKYEKILVFENEFEARLLESVLKDRNIPAVIRSYHDSAYNGIFQKSGGWGHLEAPVERKEEILSLFEELRDSQKSG